MSGRFSRSKGRRGEQELVLYLARRGYPSERNLRQFQEAHEHDVHTKTEERLTFELKLRKDSFKTIYQLYYSERNPETTIFLFAHGPEPTCVAMSSNFENLVNVNLLTFPMLTKAKNPKMKKVLDRLLRLREAKQSADFLVLRDNRKPFLFIRYW